MDLCKRVNTFKARRGTNKPGHQMQKKRKNLAKKEKKTTCEGEVKEDSMWEGKIPHHNKGPQCPEKKQIDWKNGLGLKNPPESKTSSPGLLGG